MPTGTTTGYGLLKRYNTADCSGPVIAETLVTFGLCDQQPLSYSPTTTAYAVQYLIQNVASMSANTVTLTSKNFTDASCFTAASARTYTTSFALGQCLSNSNLGLFQRYDYVGATLPVHTKTATGLLTKEYPHVGACQAKVASRSVLYAQGVCAIWQPGVYYIMSKSCYDNALGTADFTMTFYSDSACAVPSTLPSIISYAALATGSVPPCFKYELNPNARTQTFTCKRDPLMFDVPGTQVYTTYHKGAQCASKANIYAVENIVLNMCQTSDTKNPLRNKKLTWTQTNVPHQFSCKAGSQMYTLTKTSYAASDTLCSLPPTQVSKEEHEYLCRRDAATGMYKMTHCASSLPTYYSSKDQLVIKVYTRPQCDSASSSLGYLFDQCLPMHDPKSKRLLPTFQRLHHENTYIFDWHKGAPDTVVVVRQSVFADVKCATPPLSTSEVEFTNSATCKPNRLHPQLYYTYAARVSSGGALSGLSWLQAD